ncbi:hypothetical protein WCD74_06575 [Actinomycetospora sp. OC33-EN08]|uniref:Uncharacterized protein n=1 Tax=Actinomycetospora aurantiaca TaxID=3129233 RepID=A0ABU8MJC3_9PSEU
MTSDDERSGQTPFEKRPAGDQGKTTGGRSRVPTGAILGGFLALLVVLGVILFVGASCGAGGGGNGQTTGTILLLVASL